MKIEYEVNHQKCKRKDSNMIVNDSQNYLEIKFTFSEDWNNCTKFIFFRCNDINYPYGLINDKITVPAVFLKTEWLTFGVYGINDDVVITTNLCKLRLGKSYYDSETSEVDETIYTETVVEEMFDAIGTKSPKGHTHTESDVIDLKDYVVKEEGKGLFSGSYTDLTNKPTIPSDVSELTDTENTAFTPKSHTHSKSDITDFTHEHDERYYTKTEVDNIIEQTKHDLLNRIGIICDKELIQKNETVEINALVLTNGVPLPNLKVEYYSEDA